MKEIPLTQGQVALVDDADFERVNQFKWHARRAGGAFYAVHMVKNAGKQEAVRLHRFILPGIGPIDHKDGNGLNNCRDNLRPASKAQNGQAFRRKSIGASSSFRGVSRLPYSRWRAQIRTGGITYYLGCFDVEEDAALAYDWAAKELFGEFASPNFPGGKT